MANEVAEYLGEDLDEVEQEMGKEVMEEAAVHLKMVLTSHMSPVTLNIQIDLHYQMRHEKV